MTQQHSHDLIVIGAGIAGMTTALEARRLGLGVALFEELMFGGLVVNVNHLRPGLAGFPESGSDFASDLMTQVSDEGIATVFGAATGLDLDAGLVVLGDEGPHRARAIVVATGARLKPLGVPGEAEFEHRGVSHCADCDAPMFQDQDVVVVGGGDSAVQEALVLADFCRTVHLVHRGAIFTARAEFCDRLAEHANIRLHMSTVVESLEGGDALNAARVRTAEGTASIIECTGFFAYVGLQPNSGFLPPALARDAGGGIVVDSELKSSVAGVYAVGAVRAGGGGTLADVRADAVAVARTIANQLIRA